MGDGRWWGGRNTAPQLVPEGHRPPFVTDAFGFLGPRAKWRTSNSELRTPNPESQSQPDSHLETVVEVATREADVGDVGGGLEGGRAQDRGHGHGHSVALAGGGRQLAGSELVGHRLLLVPEHVLLLLLHEAHVLLGRVEVADAAGDALLAARESKVRAQTSASCRSC